MLEGIVDFYVRNATDLGSKRKLERAIDIWKMLII
jgi:hypothetical protein